MSKYIDRGIVEMDFDNSDFERNVKTSMSTIEKLKAALNFDDASNGLYDLSKAANKLDLSNISNSLQDISDRFSTMGIVAMTTVSEITKDILGSIKNISNKLLDMTIQGGISRAMNIEKAKFQLNGLGVAWEEISDDIDYGVKDTAYGLDSAARVASQLVASGVQIGDDMKSSLRAISGVAAMTDSSYDEIGAIFTTVAGQGQLMTMQLRQLETRGLNAAATLAEQLGVTEAAVREMVHKGEIDFATFSKAMDAAFGEHAKDSNKTLTGTLSNIRSAFSRIGAEFIQPLIKNEGPLVELLNAVRVQANNLKSEIIPLAKVVSDVASRMLDFAKSVVDNISFEGVFDTAIEKAEWLYKNIESIIKMFKSTIGMITHNFSKLTKAIKEAFKEVFDGQIDIKSLSNKFVAFNEKLKLTEKGFTNLKNIFKIVFSIAKGGINTIKKLYSVAKNGFKVLKSTVSKLFDGVGALAGAINETKNAGSVIESVLNNISSMITKVFDNFSDFIDSVQNGESILESALHLLEDTITDIAVSIIKSIEDVIFELTGIDVHILSDLVSKIFGYAWKKIDEFIDNFKNGGGLRGAISVFWSILKDLGNLILNKFEEITGIDLSDFKKTVSDTTKEVKDELSEWLDSFNPLDTITNKITGVSTAVVGLSDDLKLLRDSATKGFAKILENPFLTLSALLNSQTFQSIHNTLNRLTDVTGIVRALDSLRSTLTAFKQDLKFQTLLMLAAGIIAFAIGVSILAKAVGELAGIESWESTLMGLVSVLSLLGGVLATFAIVSRIMTPGVKTFKKVITTLFGKGKVKEYQRNTKATAGTILLATLSLIEIAEAVKIMINALKEVNESMPEDPELLVDSLLVVISSLALLILAFIALDLIINNLKIKAKDIAKILLLAETMKILAEAVNIMASAFGELQYLADPKVVFGKIATIIGGFAALILGMERLLSNGEIKGKIISASIGIVLFAVAIKELVNAINALETTDPWGMLAAFGIVVLLMKALANTIYTMGNRSIALKTSVALLALGLTIKMLTDSLIKLGSLDIGTLVKGFIFLEAILGSFAITVNIFKEQMKGAIQAAILFLAMAASIHIVSNAIKRLKDVDPEQMLYSVLALVTVIYALKEIANQASNNIKGAISILLLTGALSILAYALQMINKCDLGKMTLQIILLSVALFALGSLAEILESNFAGAATIAILAVSVLALSYALKALQNIPWYDLLAGIGFLTLFVAALGGLAAGAALIGTELLIGAAIIAGVLTLFAIGVAAIAGALTLMDIAFNGIAASGAGCAEAFKLIGEAIIALGKEFAEYNVEISMFKDVINILNSMCLSLGASLIVLGLGATIAAIGVAALGASLLVLSVGLAGLGIVLSQVLNILDRYLGSKDSSIGENVSKGLAEGLESGSDGVFKAGLFIGKALIATFCGVLGINSPSTVMYEIGENVDKGLENGITDNAVKVSDAASIMGDDVTNSLMDSLNSGMLDIENSDFGNMDQLMNNFNVDFSNTNLSNLEGLGDFGNLNDIINSSGYDLGSVFGDGVANGINDSTFDVTSAISNLGNNTITQTNTQINNVGNSVEGSLFSRIGKLIGIERTNGNLLGNSLADGMKTSLPNISSISETIGDTASKSISTKLNQGIESSKKASSGAGEILIKSSSMSGENAGKMMGAGYQKGLINQRGSIMNTAMNIAKSAYNAMKSFLRIKSPSRLTEELGYYTDMGFVVGMKKNSGAVEDSADYVADTAINSMTEGLKTAYDNLGSDVTDPVIKPVMDMSDVQNGATKLNSMFGKDYASSISANYKSNGQLAEESRIANSEMFGRFNGQLLNALSANSNGELPINVNVTLMGGAEDIFRVVMAENTRQIKSAGYSPLLRGY